MPSREPSLSNSDTSSSAEVVQLLENINDQAVFYPGRQHGKHLDLLLHLSRYSNLLLTITGPTGSGKTHLKNKLREQLDSGVTAVNLDASKVGKAPKLLSALESALRLEIPPRADNRQYLEEIRNHTQLLTEDGGSCLLLIDNAEELDQGALDLLLELATTSNDSRRPHLALFGRDELLKRLHDRDNQARFESVGHHLPLEAFGEVEARGYLEHRCRSVGLEHLPLNDNQFRRVYKAAHGWPGLLNKALLKELNESGPAEDTLAEVAKPAKKTAAPKKQKTRKTPLWPIFGAAVLIAGLVVGFLYYGDLSDDTSVSPTATGLISRSQQIRQDSWEGPLGESSQVIEELERRVEDLPPLEEEVAEDLSTAEPLPEEAAEADTPDATPPVETGDQPIDSPDDAPPEMAELDEPVFDPQPLQQPEPAIEEETAEQETEGFTDSGHRREAWLIDRPPNNFSLQLLASSEEATVRNFIENQDNPENFAYYQRDHAGSPWVVVYGDFSNRAQAEAAREDLPASLQNLQPWLRRFNSIQGDLNNR
ncbi:Sporulation related domain-containing protein [Marinospirillum celere]|uniref:Sporulation related domain-containing protein n=1 Tax=Marinospirillum celere TaxID=1122252 RepID=A0A1I1IQ37_9GAMM|nr:AAA family ATPase [Marinospirillum celere]SFC37812.1 Sporulation related domain-containing protein [Marinospirillum celere]